MTSQEPSYLHLMTFSDLNTALSQQLRLLSECTHNACEWELIQGYKAAAKDFEAKLVRYRENIVKLRQILEYRRTLDDKDDGNG